MSEWTAKDAEKALKIYTESEWLLPPDKEYVKLIAHIGNLLMERKGLILFLRSIWNDLGWADDYRAYVLLSESMRKEIETELGD